MLRLKIDTKFAQSRMDICEVKRKHDEESIIKNKYHFAVKNYIKHNGITSELYEQIIKYNYDISDVSDKSYNPENLLIKNNNFQESLFLSIMNNNLEIFAKVLSIKKIAKIVSNSVTILTAIKQNFIANDVYNCIVNNKILIISSNLMYVYKYVDNIYLNKLFRYYIDNDDSFDCKYFYGKLDNNNIVKYIIKGYNNFTITDNNLDKLYTTMTQEDIKCIINYLESCEIEEV